MKTLAKYFLLCVTLQSVWGAQGTKATQAIQFATLDAKKVLQVPISGTAVTTLDFASPITAIDAAQITTDGKTPGTFQLAHTKGTTFLSLRALRRGACTNLNVRCKNQTFAIEVFESENPGLCAESGLSQATSNGSPTHTRAAPWHDR